MRYRSHYWAFSVLRNQTDDFEGSLPSFNFSGAGELNLMFHSMVATQAEPHSTDGPSLL